MKIVFDTNVILDALLDRPYSGFAKDLIKGVYDCRFDGAISANTVTDIFYIARKALGNKGAREAIFELMNVFEVIPVDGKTCMDALTLPISDYEDAVLAVCAKNYEASYIVTRDEDFISAAQNSNGNGYLAGVMSPGDVVTLLEDMDSEE